MADFTAVELKPFVPAQDFGVSKRFYQDIGFALEWEREGLANFRQGSASFILQSFYLKEFVENLMLHLLVKDAAAWLARIEAAKVPDRFGVRVSKVEFRPWGMRDFTLFDPSGVLWRVAEAPLETAQS